MGSRVWREELKALGLMGLIVVLLTGFIFCVGGCASTPPTAAEDIKGPAALGGTASGEVTKTMLNPATAFAQPTGTADSRAVQNSVERQNQNTAAGEAITGVIFPGTAAYMTMLKADPIIVSLSERINHETAKDEPDGELLTRLYAEFTTHADRVKSAVKGVSPDFGSLTTINVMVLVCKDNGAAEGETGDAQSAAVAEAMTKVVEATVRKNE